MSMQSTRLRLNSSNSRADRMLKMKDSEETVDRDLWKACAGSRVKMPAINSLVCYFPEGHAEHARLNIPINNITPLPPCVLCRVDSLKLMANPETDQVFAKMLLVPIKENQLIEDEITVNEPERAMSTLTKILTQSDVSNGGGFTMPKRSAQTMFPTLNCSENTPVHYLFCMDVHGKAWNFRHVYRGSPRRHLLNGDWCTFVKQKKLMAEDSIVFMKKQNSGELHVGIRRSSTSNIIRKEGVVEASRKASSGESFEVVYYPRAGTPEYCVKASLVRKAAAIQWCPGMRFRMAFESEDECRINWFMGVIIKVVEKKSPWRQLEVRWDAPARQLEDGPHVNPWMVEPVSNLCSMPPLHLDAAFALSSPTKKLCRDQLPPTYDYLSSMYCGYKYSGGSSSSTINAGIEGSRHTAPSINEHKINGFRFKDDEAGKDDIALALTVGVAASSNDELDDADKISNPTYTQFTFCGERIEVNMEEEKEQISDINETEIIRHQY